MKFAAASALVSAMGISDTEIRAQAQLSAEQSKDKGAPMSSILKPMIGFMLPHEQFPVPELVQLGVLADQAGFDLLATSDHFQPWQSNEGHAGEAWTGQQVNHRGKYYNVNAKLYDPPATPVPLLMAANGGPKAMHRSGQYGDGLVTDPETWKQHKAEFESGAKAAGKEPRQMLVLLEQFVVVGDQKDAQTSAELWRFIPKAFKTYFNVRDPQVIQRRADTELPLQKVYGKWPVSTDPDVHAKALVELFNSGATIVNVHSGQSDQRRVIDFYGKEVLPRVRKELKQG